MPRIATKLTPTAGGGFIARKAIPADVRDEYSKLYGKSAEERFNSGPMSAQHAKARWRDWSTEIETRIANIRATRKDEGQMLTRKAARALAGEWYHWAVAKWESQRVDWAELQSMAEAHIDLDRLWNNDDYYKYVISGIADWAETSQFFFSKGLKLDDTSRGMFLEFVVSDYLAVLRLLARRRQGDYGPDEWVKQFPKAEDASTSPLALFERWIAEAKPAASTVDRWRVVFNRLENDKPTDMQVWADSLISADRSAFTVRNSWISAVRRFMRGRPARSWRETHSPR
jgi:hypothetical protein